MGLSWEFRLATVHQKACFESIINSLRGTRETSQCMALIGRDNHSERVGHCCAKAARLAAEGGSSSSPRSQHAFSGSSGSWSLCECLISLSSRFPINATQTSFRNICLEILFAYVRAISSRLGAIRSADVKLFGASARLYFRGTAALLIKALRRVQALSPDASWYCLLKPKEPNNNKHLCCCCLSLSD